MTLHTAAVESLSLEQVLGMDMSLVVSLSRLSLCCSRECWTGASSLKKVGYSSVLLEAC
jgi:hypothetical protein